MILNVFLIIFQNTYVELETPPPFMENSMLNFHFYYWNISLTHPILVDLIDVILADKDAFS